MNYSHRTELKIMDFSQFAEITGYIFFIIIVLYVTFILIKIAKTKEKKTEAENIQFNKSVLFLLLSAIAGFLLSIASLMFFDPDGKVSSEKELGIWYLTIFISTAIFGVAGFAISGKNKTK